MVDLPPPVPVIRPVPGPNWPIPPHGPIMPRPVPGPLQ